MTVACESHSAVDCGIYLFMWGFILIFDYKSVDVKDVSNIGQPSSVKVSVGGSVMKVEEGAVICLQAS